MRVLFFVALVLATGCAASTTPSEDTSASPDAAACLADLVRLATSASPGNPGYSFSECRYHGQRVYYMPEQCCDQYSALFDESCTVICAPDGGLSGGGDGRCTDFDPSTCTLVWSDPRTP